MMDRIKEPENQMMQDGISLKKYYHISRFTMKEFFEMGIQIADCLEKNALQGIYTQMVCEENIFFLNAEGWKLGDLKLFQNPDEVNVSKGGDYGMPPEYYEGHAADETGKVYELGILLYRILNYMEMPFEDICQSEWEAEQMRRSTSVPKAPRFGTDSLQNVICFACASREKRYHSLKEFKEHLEYLKSHLPKEWQETAVTGHSYKDGDYIHRSFEPKKGAQTKEPKPVIIEAAPGKKGRRKTENRK